MHHYRYYCTMSLAIFLISACSSSKQPTTSPETSEAIYRNHIEPSTVMPDKSHVGQAEFQGNVDVLNAQPAKRSHEPCVVPLDLNPIPKEEQRPFILTYETFEPNAYVKITYDTEFAYSINEVNGPKGEWRSRCKYDFDIDCDMDGIYDKNYTYRNEPEPPAGCNYKEIGFHQIAIRGDVPHLILDSFDGNDEDSTGYRLVSIDQWGDIRWKDMHGLLANDGIDNPYAIKENNPQLKAKDIPDLRDVCDMSDMFRDNATFNDPLVAAWDVSHVNNMARLFAGCSSFNQDISKWDVSNVTDMRGMFIQVSAFNQDISGWDVSNVTNMSAMFIQASAFNQDISKWNVSNVTDMSDMFLQATAFNQDISGWDVSNVEYMNSMFEDAISFDQDLSRWDVASLTSVYGMFASKDKTKTICPKCESLRQKILKKNDHLAPYQDALDFTPK